MKPSLTLRVFRLAVRDLLRRKGETKMLKAGDPAPDFAVKTHRGETVKLSG
jgi:hypothetical protein